MTKPTKSDGHPPDDKDLDRLRDIILGEEKDRLRQLDLRVSDIESRTSDVAEVLSPAMSQLVGDPVSRPEIEKPVVSIIRNAIKRDTESFADALFPVLGPAIRRAITDALKGLVQRINAAMEHSFTAKGLKWRMEAARTGEPFAQIVLRHTMLYAIQEAFLIQRGSGLILGSVHRDELLALDEDAVAAMLTAIQSFIQDSFGLSNDEPLRSVELGERTVWVINGPTAVLACVITGTPPRSVRDELMRLLESIHARFGKRLSESPDGLAGHEGLRSLMLETLREELDETAGSTSSSKSKFYWLAGILVVLVFIVVTSINAWRDRQFTRQVVDMFSSQPGYVVMSGEMQDGKLHVKGLRDPASDQPATLLESQQIAVNGVTTDFSPYQSLDHEMVIKRITQRFDLKPSTGLSLDNDELIVSGTLGSEQLTELQALPESHALIRSINLDSVRLDAGEASNVFRSALQAPDSVSFLPQDTSMAVSGSADGNWYTRARKIDIRVPGWQLDFQPLEVNLSAQLDEVIQDLSGRLFLYTRGTQLTPESGYLLDPAATSLKRANELAIALGTQLKITLEGSADGTGSREGNIRASMNRSRHMLEELTARGLPEKSFQQSMAVWDEGEASPERRSVTLKIERNVRP